MCCCDGKTKGCGTCSRVFFTILNIYIIMIIVVLIVIIYFDEIHIENTSYNGSIISFSCILILICSLGCSVSCCPNKRVLIVYSILMGILIVVHLFFNMYVCIFDSRSLLNSDKRDSAAFILSSFCLLIYELIQLFLAILIIQNLKVIHLLKMVHPAMPTTPAIQYDSRADEQNQIKQNSNSIIVPSTPTTRYDARADEENQIEHNWTI